MQFVNRDTNSLNDYLLSDAGDFGAFFFGEVLGGKLDTGDDFMLFSSNHSEISQVSKS